MRDKTLSEPVSLHTVGQSAPAKTRKAASALLLFDPVRDVSECQVGRLASLLE